MPGGERLFSARLTAATTHEKRKDKKNAAATTPTQNPDPNSDPNERPACLLYRGIAGLGKAILIVTVRAHLRNFACAGRSTRDRITQLMLPGASRMTRTI